MLQARPKAARKARGRRVLWSFAIAALILVGLGAASWLGARRAAHSNDEVERSYARLSQLDNLLQLLVEAETGQRGFLLTGQDEFLAPYLAARQLCRQPFESLRARESEVSQGQAMARVRGLIERRLGLMERAVALRRSEGVAGAARLVSGGEDKRLMDQIRRELEGLKASEAERIGQASAQAQRSSGQVLWITGVGSVWALLLAGTSLGQLRSDIRRREAAEKSAERGRVLLEQFVEHAPASVAMFDAQGQPILRSRRWNSSFAAPKSDALIPNTNGSNGSNGSNGAASGNGDGGASHEGAPTSTSSSSLSSPTSAGLPSGWDEAMARCLRGHVERREEDVVERGGEREWVRWEMRPWQAPHGGAGGAIAFIESITERKRAEESLRSSEARYREVVDLVHEVHEVIFRIDEAGRWSFLNAAWHSITGSGADEALGTSLLDWVAPRDRARCARMLNALLDGQSRGESGEVLVRARRLFGPPSGRASNALDDAREEHVELDEGMEYRSCDLAMRPVLEAGGRVVGIVGSLRDMSERQRAEDALRDSESELRALFAAMNEVVIVLGRDGKYLRIAPTRHQLLIEPEKLLGRTLQEVWGHEADAALPAIARVLDNDEPEDFEYVLTIGEQQVWFRASIAPLSEHSVLWVARDISAQKREELRREAARQGLRCVLDVADELLRAPDVDTLLRRAVDLGREKFGLERAGILLVSPGERTIRGSFGTDIEGRTIDERALRRVIPEGQSWRSLFAPIPEGQRWCVLPESQLSTWDGARYQPAPGRAEAAVTLIQLATGPIGFFRNDNGLSGRPIDRDKQELIAVYCSILGSLIQSKRGEEALRGARDELEMRVRSRTAQLMRANDDLLLEVSERERAQAQEATMSRGLRAVLSCADELLPISELDALLRRAVELGRERLGLERCSVFLLTSDGKYLQGGYGINMDGRIVAQHANLVSIGEHWFATVVAQSKKHWFPMGAQTPHFDWDDHAGRIVSTGTCGWEVVTPIPSAGGAFGVLFNDAAISGAPLDEAAQSTVALFASLLGNIVERLKAEAALKENESRLRLLFESIPHIVWTARPDGQIDYFNPQCYRYSGLEPSSSPAEGWRRIMHSDDLPTCRKRWKHSIQTGEPYIMEYRARRHDGVYRWHLGRALPLRNEAGEIVSWVGSATDIDDQKRAEETLRESETRFRQLTDSLPQVVWTATTQGRITYVNKVARQYDHTPIQSPESWDWRSILHPDDGPQVDALWNHAAHAGAPAAMECRLRTADGKYRWHLGRAVPLRDDCGEIALWIGSATDIDDQKKAEATLRRDRDELERLVMARTEEVTRANALLRSEIAEREQTEIALRTSDERFRHFMNTATFVAFMKGGDGRFIFVNDALCQAFDTRREQWVGHTLHDVLPPQDAPRVEAQDNHVLAGDVTVTALERSTAPDGSERVWFSYKFPLRDEAGRKYLGGLAIDVTEQQRAERDLRLLAEELKRSNADLEQFAYVASHDLQEPLRMVVSYLQLLERRHGAHLEGDAREFIDFAVDGARRMQSLINDLLDYSRLGRHGKQFEPVDLEQVLAGVLRVLALSIQESQAQIEHEPLPVVSGDAGQIARLLQNLLANALKFRGENPPLIRITCREVEEPAPAWEIAVRDNGIGVAPEHSERIFAVFGRLHSREDYAGTGIGLAVVKKIVERHGGSVRVESEPGAGAAFIWTVPRAE